MLWGPGTDIFYVNRVRGFLSVRCIIVEVRSPGCMCRWRLTPWRCRQAIIRAGVACGGRSLYKQCL